MQRASKLPGTSPSFAARLRVDRGQFIEDSLDWVSLRTATDSELATHNVAYGSNSEWLLRRFWLSIKPSYLGGTCVRFRAAVGISKGDGARALEKVTNFQPPRARTYVPIRGSELALMYLVRTDEKIDDSREGPTYFSKRIRYLNKMVAIG